MFCDVQNAVSLESPLQASVGGSFALFEIILGGERGRQNLSFSESPAPNPWNLCE